MKTALFILLTVAAFLYLMPAFADVIHDASWGIRECLDCHPRANPTHRPLKPGEMRADLPLDKQGRMLCITCHQCIAGTCTIPKDKTELCRVCHDCTQGMACVLQTSHIGASKDIRHLATERCLECHGKTLEIEVCELGDRTMDVLYFQSSKKSLKSKPDERVVLVEGKMTCLSCHDPFSPQRAKLIISNRESAMCFACHNRLEQVDHTAYDEGIRACMGCHPRAWPTHRRATVEEAKTDLPLDARERMLCMTCHNCVSGTCLLRLEKRELCASCHDCTQGMACLLGSAHLGTNREKKGITRAACLECHDDSTVQSCGLAGAPGSPIDNIGCTSCHDPYSSRHIKLPQGTRVADALKQNACPRNLVGDIPDCLECHPERR